MVEKTNRTMSEREAQAFWEGEFDEVETPETTEEALAELPEEDAQEKVKSVQVRFNGQDVQVPLDQAAALIQKGMNYDHVREELELLRSKPANQLIRAMAEKSGMSAGDFMQQMRSQLGMSETGRTEQLRAFFERNPSLGPQDIPNQVLAAMQEGEDVESAYARFENAALRQRIAQLEEELSNQRQSRNNRARGIGSMMSLPPKNEADEGWKAFMEG